ncbi:hypothetical protein EON65_47075 [archaeon]|nr:MAG: hypothetical protein EON65_47075 [archaeon]
MQDELALLEGLEGAKFFAFSTGMAALSTVAWQAQAGDEVIVNYDSYGETYRLMSMATMTTSAAGASTRAITW